MSSEELVFKSNKLVSVRSGIPDQRTTHSLEGTLVSGVSANSVRHKISSDANKSLGLSRTRKFATQFTRVPIWSLTLGKGLQRISSRSILILSCHKRLSFQSCPIRFFPTKTLYAFLVSHMPASCSAHLIVLVLITIIINVEGYKFCSFPLLNILYSPVGSCQALGSYTQEATSLIRGVQNLEDDNFHDHNVYKIFVSVRLALSLCNFLLS